MSTRYNNGSHYENHQRATELQDLPAHVHNAAAARGEAEDPKPVDHLVHNSGHNGNHNIVEFGHKETAALAYQLWQQRGSPEGTADEDWFHATTQLRSKNIRGAK